MFNQNLFTQYLGTTTSLPLTIPEAHYFFKSFEIIIPDSFPPIHTMHSIKLRPFKSSIEQSSLIVASLIFDIEYVSKTITHSIHNYSHSIHITQHIPLTITSKNIQLSCINLYAISISSNLIYISAFFMLH